VVWQAPLSHWNCVTEGVDQSSTIGVGDTTIR
jgi:hypothetical protein